MIKAEDNIVLKSTKSVNDTATDAKAIADNTNQYFWYTSSGSDTGAHITEKTKEAFLADPANGGGNLLARSNGIAVRDGLTELASFGANGAVIGAENDSHIKITNEAFTVYGADSSTPFSISKDNILQTQTVRKSVPLSASGGDSETYSTSIYLRGIIPNSRMTWAVGARATTLILSNELKTETRDGVTITYRLLSPTVIEISLVNASTTAKRITLSYTEEYYEKIIVANGALLGRNAENLALQDDRGTSQNAKIITYGCVAMVSIDVYNTASVVAHDFVYTGNLLDHFPETAVNVLGVWGSSPRFVVGTLSEGGLLRVINMSDTAITPTAGDPITLTATYIFK